MSDPQNSNTRYARAADALTSRGQHHVLRWWDELSLDRRTQLLRQLESIDWGQLDPLVESHVRTKPERHVPDPLEPPPVYPLEPRPDQQALYAAARDDGKELLHAGKVAAFTVAGGQGTRLGHDGPKGTVVVTPLGKRTLFQLFAEMILAARRRYDSAIPWYIMTSNTNHEETIGFLRDHEYFGLPESEVMLFQQGMLPVFGFDHRILMDDKHRISMAPDGHGGSLQALVRSGAVEDMRARGVAYISYFQVDNPLVQPVDPLFLGLHHRTGSEMSCKVSKKADDLERVGNYCLHEGTVRVIEYFEFPESLARQRNPDGTRKFDAANLAIHAMNVDFVDRIVGKSFQLPYRRAEKAVPFVDEGGQRREPDQPNAVKLETFVFDALPLARRTALLEVDRAEEFSPVKNAAGVDSLETAKRDQVARACRWLEAADVSVPRSADGSPDITVAISPLFALDVNDVRAKRAQVPELRPGDSIFIE